MNFGSALTGIMSGINDGINTSNKIKDSWAADDQRKLKEEEFRYKTAPIDYEQTETFKMLSPERQAAIKASAGEGPMSRFKWDQQVGDIAKEQQAATAAKDYEYNMKKVPISELFPGYENADPDIKAYIDKVFPQKMASAGEFKKLHDQFKGNAEVMRLVQDATMRTYKQNAAKMVNRMDELLAKGKNLDPASAQELADLRVNVPIAIGKSLTDQEKLDANTLRGFARNVPQYSADIDKLLSRGKVADAIDLYKAAIKEKTSMAERAAMIAASEKAANSQTTAAMKLLQARTDRIVAANPGIDAQKVAEILYTYPNDSQMVALGLAELRKAIPVKPGIPSSSKQEKPGFFSALFSGPKHNQAVMDNSKNIYLKNAWKSQGIVPTPQQQDIIDKGGKVTLEKVKEGQHIKERFFLYFPDGSRQQLSSPKSELWADDKALTLGY
jgi:hypothetical protein